MSFLVPAPELKVRINGTLMGYITGLTYNAAQGQKMLYGVDSPFPQEIAQGAGPSFVEGSFEMLRTKGGAPETWGFMTPRSSTDGVSESGNPNVTALGAAKYSTIEILDRQTDNLLLKISYAMFGTQNWSVMTKDLLKGTVTFQGVILDHGNNFNGSFI